MLDVPSSALNGRYESPLVTHDVALALARKVTGLQRQIVLELRTPSPDRKPSESVADQRRKTGKEDGKVEAEPQQTARDLVVADTENASTRIDILV